MNLADANNVSPLLDEFSLGSPYSSHNGIICCPAIHAVTKEKFILKQISIPESQTQVNAMLLTGACADKAAAQRYYADITQGLVEEIHLLERLAQTRGFAAFFSHQTTPKEGDETGMDLWVLSPYRTTLDRLCQAERHDPSERGEFGHRPVRRSDPVPEGRISLPESKAGKHFW